MNILKWGLILLSLILTTGCATPKLVPVTYTGAVKHKSDYSANVQLNTGKVTGYSSTTMIYAGGIFVPITSGPVPALQFGEEDQKIFLESLRSELQKHGIIASLSEQPSNEPVEILVNFVQTEHYPNFQEYRITALLQLRHRGKVANKKYNILSSEGDSIWTKMNTSAFQGKKKAAEKLLAAIMPDIEDFLYRLSSDTTPNSQ